MGLLGMLTAHIPREDKEGPASIAMSAAGIATGAALMSQIAGAGLNDLRGMMHGGGAVESIAAATVAGEPSQGKGGPSR